MTNANAKTDAGYDELLEKAYARMPQKTSGERFEMPVFNVLIQGNQTFIRNITEVAAKLRREPMHLLRFISKAVGSPGSMQGKQAMLQSKIREDLLNTRLKEYVEEYVLCKECKKLDTNLVSIKGVKHKQCEVCGARSPVKQT